MQTTTVRVNREAHAVLQELAAEEHMPAGRILQKALDDYRRRVYLRKVGEAYAALRSEAKNWKKEAAERKLWDATIEDGDEKDK